MSTLSEIEAQLTAPGAPFEMVEEEVLGQRMHVFKQRFPHLRALVDYSIVHGDQDYLVFGDDFRISFKEHHKVVASVAKALRERFGVEKGDRVAILAANCPEWVVSFFAIASLGAIAVGMNGWWVGDEIEFGLQDSEPKLLIADKKRLARLEGKDPGVPTVVIEDAFEAIWNHDLHAAMPTTEIVEDDPLVILYTSGTTGRPKGAVHSHRNVLALMGVQFFHGARLQALSPPPPDLAGHQHCRLNSNPLFHVSGLHASAVAHLGGGVKSVWTVGRFEPEKVLRLIDREKVNGWGPMGSMAYKVLHCPNRTKYDVSSMTSIGCGGAPVTREIQRDLREAFPNAKLGLAVGYGQTECSALATMIWGEDLHRHPSSVGSPLPTIDVEIRDPRGKHLGEGKEGEIWVRGPVVMLEYWRNPKATAEVLDEGRWLRTGDIGYFENHRLYISTRKRDLILRAAENVYPAEIENRLAAHPDVEEAAVVGVEHAELGQEVKAIVIPLPGRTIHEENLRDWVAETLAYYKVPTIWELRQEPLPRNASGKIMKYLLQPGAENPLVEE